MAITLDRNSVNKINVLEQRMQLSKNDFYDNDYWQSMYNKNSAEDMLTYSTSILEAKRRNLNFKDVRNDYYLNDDYNINANGIDKAGVLYNELYADRKNLIERELPVVEWKSIGGKMAKTFVLDDTGKPLTYKKEMSDYDYYKELRRQEGISTRVNWLYQDMQQSKNEMNWFTKNIINPLFMSAPANIFKGFIDTAGGVFNTIGGIVIAALNDEEINKYQNIDSEAGFQTRLHQATDNANENAFSATKALAAKLGIKTFPALLKIANLFTGKDLTFNNNEEVDQQIMADFDEAVDNALQQAGLLNFGKDITNAIVEFESKYTSLRTIDGSYSNKFSEILTNINNTIGQIAFQIVASRGIGSFIDDITLPVNAAGEVNNVNKLLKLLGGQATTFGTVYSNNVKESKELFAKSTIDEDVLAHRDFVEAYVESFIEIFNDLVGFTTDLDKIKYGFDTIDSITDLSFKAVSKQLLASAIQEGSEEVIQDITNVLIDDFYGSLGYKDIADSSEFSWQRVADAFIVAFASTALLGTPNMVNSLRTEKTVTFGGKTVKLNKLQATFFDNTFEAIVSQVANINNYDANGNLTQVTRESFMDAYAGFKMLSQIYGMFGDERFKNAVDLYDKIVKYEHNKISAERNSAFEYIMRETALSLNRFKVEGIDKSNKLDKVKNFIDKNIKKRHIEGKAEKVTAEEDVEAKINDILTKEEPAKPEHSAKAVNTAKAILNDGEHTNLIVTENGTAPMTVGDTAIVPETILKNEETEQVVKSLVTHDIYCDIVNEPSFSELVNTLVEVYKKANTDYDGDVEKVLHLFFFDDLYRSEVIANTDTIVFNCIAAINNLLGYKQNKVSGKKQSDANKQYIEVLRSVRTSIVRSCTEYCCMNPFADYSLFLSNLEQSEISKIREYIDNNRLNLTMEMKIQKNALTEADKVTLKNICETAYGKNDVADTVYKLLTSNATASSKQSQINKLYSKLNSSFNKRFNNKYYPVCNSTPAMVFAKFLMHSGLNLQTFLKAESLTEADKQQITKDTGLINFGPNEIFKYRHEQFKNFAGKGFKLVKEGTTNNIVARYASAIFDTPRKSQLAGTYEEDVRNSGQAAVIVDKHGSRKVELEAMLNDSVPDAYRATIDVNDLIANPSLLNEELYNGLINYGKNFKGYVDENKINPYIVYKFLANKLMASSDGLITVSPNKDGTYSIVSLEKMSNVLPSDNTIYNIIYSKNNFTIGDVFPNLNIPEQLKSIKIMKSVVGSDADAYFSPHDVNNSFMPTIFIPMNDTVFNLQGKSFDTLTEDDIGKLREFAFNLLHETIHSIQLNYGLNEGSNLDIFKLFTTDERKAILNSFNRMYSDKLKTQLQSHSAEDLFEFFSYFMYENSGELEANGINGVAKYLVPPVFVRTVNGNTIEVSLPDGTSVSHVCTSLRMNKTDTSKFNLDSFVASENDSNIDMATFKEDVERYLDNISAEEHAITGTVFNVLNAKPEYRHDMFKYLNENSNIGLTLFNNNITGNNFVLVPIPNNNVCLLANDVADAFRQSILFGIDLEKSNAVLYEDVPRDAIKGYAPITCGSRAFNIVSAGEISYINKFAPILSDVSNKTKNLSPSEENKLFKYYAKLKDDIIYNGRSIASALYDYDILENIEMGKSINLIDLDNLNDTKEVRNGNVVYASDFLNQYKNKDSNMVNAIKTLFKQLDINYLPEDTGLFTEVKTLLVGDRLYIGKNKIKLCQYISTYSPETVYYSRVELLKLVKEMIAGNTLVNDNGVFYFDKVNTNNYGGAQKNFKYVNGHIYDAEVGTDSDYYVQTEDTTLESSAMDLPTIKSKYNELLNNFKKYINDRAKGNVEKAKKNAEAWFLDFRDEHPEQYEEMCQMVKYVAVSNGYDVEAWHGSVSLVFDQFNVSTRAVFFATNPIVSMTYLTDNTWIDDVDITDEVSAEYANLTLSEINVRDSMHGFKFIDANGNQIHHDSPYFKETADKFISDGGKIIHVKEFYFDPATGTEQELNEDTVMDYFDSGKNYPVSPRNRPGKKNLGLYHVALKSSRMVVVAPERNVVWNNLAFPENDFILNNEFNVTDDIYKHYSTALGVDSIIRIKGILDTSNEIIELLPDGYNDPLATSDVIITKNTKAVKSLDPITFDRDGNIVPIEERFNDTTTLLWQKKNIDGNNGIDLVFDDVKDYVAPKNKAKKFTYKDSEYFNRRRLTQKAAANSNLKYFTKPYQVTLMSEDLRNLIELSTTTKLDKILQDKIDGKHAGTLTRNDVLEYLRNADDIDDDTFSAINATFFKNENVTSLKELDDLVNNFEDVYAIRPIMRKFEYDAILTGKKFNNDTLNKLKEFILKNKELNKLYTEIKIRYNNYPHDHGVDRLSVLRYFDGSIFGLSLAALVSHENAIINSRKGISLEGKVKSNKKGSGDNERTFEETIGDGESIDYGDAATQSNADAVEQGSAYGSDADEAAAVRTGYSSTTTSEIGKSWTNFDDSDEQDHMRRELVNKKILEIAQNADSLTPARASNILQDYGEMLRGLKGRQLFELYSKEILLEDIDVLSEAEKLTVEKEKERAAKEIADAAEQSKSSSTHMMNRAYGYIRTIKRNLRARDVKKFVEDNSDLFNDDLTLKKDQYLTDTLTKKKSHIMKVKTVDELEPLVERLKTLSAKVRANYYGSATAAKAIDTLTKRIKKLEKENGKIKVETEAKHKEQTIVLTNDTFTVTASKTMPEKLTQLMNTTFTKTLKSKTQYVTDGDKRHLRMGVDKFFKDNAETLASLTQQDVDDILDFLLTATVSSTNAIDKYNSVQIWMLTYLYKGQNVNWKLSQEQKQAVANKIEQTVSKAMQQGAVWREAMKELDPTRTVNEELLRKCKIAIPDDDEFVTRFSDAVSKGDINDIVKRKEELYAHILEIYKSQKNKKSVMTKLLRFQQLSMLSSPGTWVRNAVSNFIVSGGDKTGAAIGNLTLKLFKKKHVAGQYKIIGTEVSSEVKRFIQTNIIESGLYKLVNDGLSKYDAARNKNKNDTDAFLDVITKSISNEVFNSNTFDTKPMQMAQNVVFKMLSDDPWVSKRMIYYLGKTLTEDEVDLSEGLNKNILEHVAKAYSLAANDYMHKDNAIKAIEARLREYANTRYGGNSADAIMFAYKQIFPFAATSFNWLLEGIKYTPVGLAKAIINAAKLESTIEKYTNAAAEGRSNIDPKFAEYITKRDIGKGVIGSVTTLIGILLAALGIAGIDEKDDKYKLRVGNVRVDISNLFGTQGIFMGIAIIDAIKADANESKFDRAMRILSNTADVLLQDSTLTDIYTDFRYASSIGDLIGEKAYDSLNMTIPNFFKTVTSLTTPYSVKYSPGIKGKAERLVATSIPFAAAAFPHSFDIYTGEEQIPYHAWFLDKAVDKLLPIGINNYNISDTELTAISYGVHKQELNGKYTINDKKYNLKADDVAELNKLYGQLNKKSLSDLMSNRKKYRVQKDNGEYVELTFSKMNDAQKKTVIERLMNDNSQTAKIYILTSRYNLKYYCSEADRKELKSLGVSNNNIKVKDKKHDGFVS